MAGSTCYVLGILFLNIIILNIVIALVGDVYDSVVEVKDETELKLKAEMLKELYDLDYWFPFTKQSFVKGNLYIMKLAHEGEDEVDKKDSDSDDEDWQGKVKSIVNKT